MIDYLYGKCIDSFACPTDQQQRKSSDLPSLGNS